MLLVISIVFRAAWSRIPVHPGSPKSWAAEHFQLQEFFRAEKGDLC